MTVNGESVEASSSTTKCGQVIDISKVIIIHKYVPTYLYHLS